MGKNITTKETLRNRIAVVREAQKALDDECKQLKNLIRIRK